MTIKLVHTHPMLKCHEDSLAYQICFGHSIQIDWKNNLKLISPPAFLQNCLLNREQPIFMYRLSLKTILTELDYVFCLKLVMGKLENIYHEVANLRGQGVLFMVSDSQNNLFFPLADLFSYQAPHLDQYGEQNYWYLPTDQSHYDDFVELSFEINQQLDQFLWREQKNTPWIRSFFNEINLRESVHQRG